jgi:hypothetical protein
VDQNVTDVATRRLRTQRLAGEPFASPLDAVRFLGAVQAQDYHGAKWALGQRTRGFTDADLDRLCDEGAILRTHVLRPTWHFVLPEDIHWLLELTAPRVRTAMGFYGRSLGADAALVTRAHREIEAALRGTSLTRGELKAALDGSGIPVSNPVLGHLLMHAELDGLVVSGPRRGRQSTYALLAERAPSARRLDRDEALAELTLRYFTSHGPAQAQDFTWWSGLTMADARRGLALAGDALAREERDGRTFWSAPEAPPAGAEPVVHLLPNFDEYLVAYRDRSDAQPPGRQVDAAAILANTVVVNGRVRGGWKRRTRAGQVVLELRELDAMDAEAAAALERAAADFQRFLGVPVTVTAT